MTPNNKYSDMALVFAQSLPQNNFEGKYCMLLFY